MTKPSLNIYPLPVFPFSRIVGSMHKPKHASVLPGHIAPIPMPDSPREAELLVLLLEAGLYPKIAPVQSEEARPDQG
jgi:hypothetical protein